MRNQFTWQLSFRIEFANLTLSALGIYDIVYIICGRYNILSIMIYWITLLFEFTSTHGILTPAKSYYWQFFDHNFFGFNGVKRWEIKKKSQKVDGGRSPTVSPRWMLKSRFSVRAKGLYSIVYTHSLNAEISKKNWYFTENFHKL